MYGISIDLSNNTNFHYKPNLKKQEHSFPKTKKTLIFGSFQANSNFSKEGSIYYQFSFTLHEYHFPKIQNKIMVFDKAWYQMGRQMDRKAHINLQDLSGTVGEGFQKFDYFCSVFVPCLAGGYHLHKKGKKAILKRFILLENLQQLLRVVATTLRICDSKSLVNLAVISGSDQIL